MVDIEEAAANDAERWIGDRAAVPPGIRTIFRRFWDKVMHALRTLKIVPEGSQIKDLYWKLEQDKLDGQPGDTPNNPMYRTLTPTDAEIAEAERQMADVRAKYEGTDKWLKAPNGKPTNLNERQWLQVRTKAFKDWFGDWENDPENASKVVDENGEPMVVYHGTSSSKVFHTFKDSKGKRHEFHFGTAKQASIRSPYGHIGQYFLNIRKIKETRDIKDGHGNEIKKAIKDGYDGMYYPNIWERDNFWYDEIENSYIVFSPTQIKSATGNVGTFDKENPDIRYRLQPSTDDYDSPYRSYLTPFRGEITKGKILSRLKHINAPKGRAGLFAEIRKFKDAEEFAAHIFYHGTANYIEKGLKPSVAFSDRYVEQNGGGGYGEKYWGISLSKSKNMASNFSGMSRSVTVYPVILRKGSKVIALPAAQDAADLDDVIIDLWKKGVDAAMLGNWEDGSSEQELVVLNPKAIYTFDNPDTYAIFGKKRLTELSKDQIQEIYDIAFKREGAFREIMNLPKEDRLAAVREITKDVRYRLVDEEVNAKFNEEIEKYFRGELDKYHVFSMGNPGSILKISGFPDIPIHLLQGTISNKTDKHNLQKETLIDLPLAINDPIFAMESLTHPQTRLVVFTELYHPEGNVLLAAEINTKHNNININKVISVYGKDNDDVMNWLIDHQDDEKFRYLNNEKSLTWLRSSRGSNSPSLSQLTQAINKINESVGLSSPKFTEARKALQIGEFSPNTRYRLLHEDIEERIKNARALLDKHNKEYAKISKEASEKLAEEVGEQLGITPEQAKEKIARMTRAAYREGEEKARRAMAAMGIAMTTQYMADNKPDTKDRSDLTFHLDEAMDYAMDMGISEEDINNLGTDLTYSYRENQKYFVFVSISIFCPPVYIEEQVSL